MTALFSCHSLRRGSHLRRGFGGQAGQAFGVVMDLKKLGLFGFVFLEPESGFILVILCGKEGCIRFCP